MSKWEESKQNKAQSTITQSVFIVLGLVLIAKLLIVSPGPNKNRSCGEPFIFFIEILESNFKGAGFSNF